MKMTLPEGIKEVERRFEAEEFQASNELALNLHAHHQGNAYCSFLIGRNYRYMGEFARARSWIDSSISREQFPWAFYELALIQEHLDEALEAGASALRFIQATGPDFSLDCINRVHRDATLRIAHKAFEGSRRLSLEIYRACRTLGISDYLSHLRIVESSVDEGAADHAFREMTTLRARYELDAWGLFALSRVHLLLGDIPAACDALRDVVTDDAACCYLLVQSAHLYLEMAAVAEATAVSTTLRNREAGAGSSDIEELLGLEFRLATVRHDAREVVRLLDHAEARWQTRKWLLVTAMFAFALPGDVIKPEDLFVSGHLRNWIENNFTATLEEVHALLHYYSRRRLWREVNALLEEIRTLDVYSHPEVTVRRFEICCFMGDLDGAEQIYRQHMVKEDLTQWEALASMSFLAERGYWGEAGQVMIGALRRGHQFAGCEQRLLQIARKTATQEEVLLMLCKPQGAGNRVLSGSLDILRQVLIDDLCVAKSVSELASAAGRLGSISDRNKVLLGQSEFRTPSLRYATALYLCTDKAYFFSVLTFLCSFIEHNRGQENRPILYLFLGDDVPPEWTLLAARFVAKLGTSIHIVRENEFVPREAEFENRYGIYTGGGSLSRAAFFRIYAARYLRRTGRFHRLCYIDSDIVCRGDLNELFDMDFQGGVMAARREEMSPEVHDAAIRNGIDPAAYFNSGVLLMEGGSENVARCLDLAISLAEDRSSRLTFHDQCALNIGFAGEVMHLPDVFNYFVRPNRADNGDLESGRLLHFLDRPKPWDVAYTREYRRLWSRHAEVVKLLVDPREFRDIVIAANSVT